MKRKIIDLIISVLFWFAFLFATGELQKILEKLKQQQTPGSDGVVKAENIFFANNNGVQTLTFTVLNNTEDELWYNGEYDLYVQSSGDYITVEPKRAFVTDELSKTIEHGASERFGIVLSDKYDVLHAGSYRVSKTVGCLLINVDFNIE